MLSVKYKSVMLIVIMFNVIMLSVVMLSAMAPTTEGPTKKLHKLYATVPLHKERQVPITFL